MVKISGGRSGSVNRLKKEFERSSGSRTWIRNVKEGEDLTVRFLTQPDEWYAYREHYDPEVHFFPCIGKDNACPGCESPSDKVQRTSRRYLANALDVEAGTVIPLKLTLDLAQRLVASYERYGNTIVDRDYTLHRLGKGLETTYDRTPEEKSEVDLSRYELIDPEKVLIQQFEDTFDLESDDKEDPGSASTSKSSKVEADTDTDLDDEVPSEPSASAEDDDEDGYLTEEEARKMSKDELKALAGQLGVEVDGRWTVDKMVDKIFSEAG